MKTKIPYYSLAQINTDVREQLKGAFQSVINSNWYVLGQELELFEKKFAEYIHVKFAIGVGNGMDALRISLQALDLKSGDEVILPSLTYIATLIAVVQSGAKPVLVDINSDTCVLDPDLITERLTNRTRVILPVHLYGRPCPVPEMLHIARERNILVVEDYAQSVGAEINGSMTGSIGHINATSFYPTKTLGALGDGGMITTNEKKYAIICRSLRNYGFKDQKMHIRIGSNSRLDEIQAAFLMKKLVFLDHWIKQKKKIADTYIELLKDVEGIILPDFSGQIKPSYHIFPIRIKKRDALKTYLEQKGIETRIHYEVPMHMQKSMKFLGYKKGSFPVTEEIIRTEISLPIYPGLSDTHVEYIAENIREFVKLH